MAKQMRSEKVSEARRLSIERFDAKTYKKVLFTLRLQDDADIIKDIEAAQSNGMTLRAWLRSLFDRANG